MDIYTLQVFAGFTSSAMFVSGNLPMIFKAFKTKNLKSYSLGHITLGTLGNLIYWLYIAGLPFGPVWFLQGFFTISSALMLFWYLRYEKGWVRSPSGDETRKPIMDQHDHILSAAPRWFYEAISNSNQHR